MNLDLQRSDRSYRNVSSHRHRHRSAHPDPQGAECSRPNCNVDRCYIVDANVSLSQRSLYRRN